MHDTKLRIPRDATPTRPDDLRDATLVVAYLTAWFDVAVTVVDQIPAEPCDWCALDGRVTQARVYGDPVDDSTAWTVTECCIDCIPAATERAHRELRDGSRVGVRLEVAA